MTCHKMTNLSNRGLISEDRSTKATQDYNSSSLMDLHFFPQNKGSDRGVKLKFSTSISFV